MISAQTKCCNLIYLFLALGLTLGCSNTDQYDKLAKQSLEKGFPGIIIGVQAHDKAPQISAAGLANIEQRIPMETDDRFHIASITKLFTSVAALKLVNENKLSLNSPIDSLLPDSLIERIPNIDQIEVQHLLDHSSGIYSFNNDMRYIGTIMGKQAEKNISWTSEELVALAYDKSQGKPGTGHYYADTNTILLSMIIEKISGLPFRQHIHKTILKPLKLTNTGFYSRNSYADNAELSTNVQGYLKESDILNSFIELSPSFERVSDSLLNTTTAVEKIDASAGMVSTAGDLLKFGRAVYKKNFLSDESLTWMLSIGNGIADEEMGTVRQGVVTVRKKPYGILYTSLGDGGGGINTMLAYHPEQDLIVVAFTNIFGRFDEHDYFIDELVPTIINN